MEAKHRMRFGRFHTASGLHAATGEPAGELFNMADDFAETTNLYEKRPGSWPSCRCCSIGTSSRATAGRCRPFLWVNTRFGQVISTRSRG